MSSISVVAPHQMYSTPKKEIPTSLTNKISLVAEMAITGGVLLIVGVPVLGWRIGTTICSFGITAVNKMYKAKTAPIKKEAYEASILAYKATIKAQETAQKTATALKTGMLATLALITTYVSNSIMMSTCNISSEGSSCIAARYFTLTSVVVSLGMIGLLIKNYRK